jgi:hypothetical protein
VTLDAPVYEFHRPRLWGSRLVRCALDDGNVTVEVEGKQPLRIPYQEITAVHLSARSHGRNEAAMQVRDFRCRVTAGRQSVEITNRSDRGVGHRFQYQNQAFNAFVRELHRRLLPHGNPIQFRSGHSLSFGLVVALGALTAIIAPFRLVSYEGHLALGIATYSSAVLGLLVAARRLRPRSYPPANIPDKLLPKDQDSSGLWA